MFRGSHDLNIDTKGRLAFPAKFRDVLSRKFIDDDEEPRLVATLESSDRVLIYPESEWEKVEMRLLELNVNGNPILQAYQNLLLHNAETLELDAAGRILIPTKLRQLTGLEKDVTLVGRVNRLELWNRDKKTAETEQALSMDRDDLNEQLSKTELRL